MKALCISHDPWRQMHKFLRIISSLGKDLMVTMAISMMTILMTMTLSLMRISLPESREDPHSGPNKLNKEEAGSEVGGKVEQAVGVLEQVRHTWSSFGWLVGLRFRLS